MVSSDLEGKNCISTLTKSQPPNVSYYSSSNTSSGVLGLLCLLQGSEGMFHSLGHLPSDGNTALTALTNARFPPILCFPAPNQRSKSLDIRHSTSSEPQAFKFPSLPLPSPPLSAPPLPSPFSLILSGKITPVKSDYPGFKSWLLHLQGLWAWISQLSSRGPSLFMLRILICKTARMIKSDYCKAPSTTLGT